MKNPKHTPGPWKQHKGSVQVGIHNLNRGIDVGPSGMSIAIVIGEFEKSEPGPEAEANARLIAAAPDMLELLKEFTSEDVEWSADTLDGFADAMREVIARAEGKESKE